MRRRWQTLLEGLATSLQLVDPLGKHAHADGLAPKDDRVFLRLVSIRKGRKLLSKVSPATLSSRRAHLNSLYIFRHLIFLFSVLPSDSGATETTTNLSRVVSSCVRGMDLSAVSVCLTVVVCSSKQPPFRPLEALLVMELL